MKKNEKGFTLIELLAVIVILAVIALIATPIVMNVLNQSRKKAAEDSAYGVIEAVKSYHAEKMLDETAVVSNSLTVEWNTDGTVKSPNETLKISGSKPQAGTVTIDGDTGIITVTDLKINGYTCNGTDATKITCDN